jgi:membrane protease subunit HflC
MRLRNLNIQSSRIMTSEKKDVLVDYYIKWQIDDLGTYFIRTSGDAQRAELLLSQQLNDALRAEFGRRTIGEVVSEERSDIMSRLSQLANDKAKLFGIRIVDVRIKGIDLPDEVSAAVFETMKAERKRVADEHRARGQAEAESIRADADAKVTILLAQAAGQAESLRGQGEGQASRIYALAYQKDPEFYAFNQSLNAYNTALANPKTVFVIKPDSEFFHYLRTKATST